MVQNKNRPPHQMFYTYVLVDRNDNFYIGYSNDLKKRLEKHQKEKVVATKFKHPLKLVYYEAALNKYDALNREKYLKSGPGHKFLRYRLRKFFNERAGAR